MPAKQKELKVRRAPTYVMYEVYYEDGGQVPEELKGKYTKEYVAQHAIEAYLASGKKRNGPKVSTGS